jgi:hypothetical protein
MFDKLIPHGARHKWRFNARFHEDTFTLRPVQ